MSRALKENDFVEFSKLYEAEFNQPDIHDRILVFDVVGRASWLRSQTKPNIEESVRREDKASTHSNDEQIKTETSDNEADQTVVKQTEKSTSKSTEKELESNDCKIRTEQSQTVENEASDEIKNDDIQAATEASKSEDAMKAIKNESALNESPGINLQDSKILPDSSDTNTNHNKKQSGDDIGNYAYRSSNAINEDEIIRQHKFYIHSSWLAVQSTYFRSMFFSGMKETNAREVHVQISVCEEKYHLMLLEAMYKIDILEKASVGELLEVLRLAHKYDVKFVFKKCKYCLQATVVSLEICEQVMRFIKIDNDIMDVEDLASTLQSFLAKEFSPLDKTWLTTSFEELCEPSLRYLLSSDDLVVVTENTVFHALIHWIKQRGLDNVLNDKKFPSLLSVVRFEVMPIDYLYNIVQHNPVAKKLVNFNQYYLKGISYHALSDEMRQRLPRQTLKRKGVGESYVAYTWVIPIEKLTKVALRETEKRLISDEFWFCGYKMRLTIDQVQQQQYYAGWVVTFCLVIINLTQQSVVQIKWQPTCHYIGHNSNTMHTFKTDARVSSCKIHLNIEDMLASTVGEIALPAAVSKASAKKETSRSVFQAKPETTVSGFSFGGRTNTNTLASGKVNPPQTENPEKPCISINVNMNMC